MSKLDASPRSYRKQSYHSITVEEQTPTSLYAQVLFDKNTAIVSEDSLRDLITELKKDSVSIFDPLSNFYTTPNEIVKWKIFSISPVKRDILEVLLKGIKKFHLQVTLLDKILTPLPLDEKSLAFLYVATFNADSLFNPNGELLPLFDENNTILSVHPSVVFNALFIDFDDNFKVSAFVLLREIFGDEGIFNLLYMKKKDAEALEDVHDKMGQLRDVAIYSQLLSDFFGKFMNDEMKKSLKKNKKTENYTQSLTSLSVSFSFTDYFKQKSPKKYTPKKRTILKKTKSSSDLLANLNLQIPPLKIPQCDELGFLSPKCPQSPNELDDISESLKESPKRLSDDKNDKNRYYTPRVIKKEKSKDKLFFNTWRKSREITEKVEDKNSKVYSKERSPRCVSMKSPRKSMMFIFDSSQNASVDLSTINEDIEFDGKMRQLIELPPKFFSDQLFEFQQALLRELCLGDFTEKTCDLEKYFKNMFALQKVFENVIERSQKRKKALLFFVDTADESVMSGDFNSSYILYTVVKNAYETYKSDWEGVGRNCVEKFSLIEAIFEGKKANTLSLYVEDRKIKIPVMELLMREIESATELVVDTSAEYDQFCTQFATKLRSYLKVIPPLYNVLTMPQTYTPDKGVQRFFCLCLNE
ncbi:hypothetical protein EIN_087680 [Entamoeba invadens IP1]|uniref:hypothetical protein n=1 Tax=Entamoeba invadens IP1 TaxID=370355 RepID=UPI0002C3EFCE|nr:hypothetical protein EIN_087680 [Entamoeba invadens IP1]ELP85446.1 hypothetical protein EIN_087680 [Entamoeba invadens IP1]|eukprot:XP_004184792.1 hypothetical protein EIN_087680 [Entamoeba invadens IP1]